MTAQNESTRLELDARGGCLCVGLLKTYSPSTIGTFLRSFR